MSDVGRVLYLSGGVGGARLLHGLDRASRSQPEMSLTSIVNTGDDFEHWGLSISPDIDTVMYTLGELADEARGWGLKDESFRTKSMMERYGEPVWFALGDLDLATHLTRSAALRRGERLTDVTARLCAAAGVASRVLPMADAPRRTDIVCEAGTLPFQNWFVEHRAESPVRAVQFVGESQPTPEVLQAIEASDLVIVGPSNPYVSIDPILTLDGVREALVAKTVVAVSPIVGGRAVKGPLASMIGTLAERPASAAAIAAHYDGLLDAIVVEQGDEDEIQDLPVCGLATVMGGAEDRERLAREVLAFARGIR